jgi:hypothetical protein
MQVRKLCADLWVPERVLSSVSGCGPLAGRLDHEMDRSAMAPIRIPLQSRGSGVHFDLKSYAFGASGK